MLKAELVADDPGAIAGTLESGQKLWSNILDLAKHHGWPLATLISAAVIALLLWWFWEDIKKRPGIDGLVRRFTHLLPGQRIYRATPNHLTIAVAQLENDPHREQEKFLRDQLAHEFSGVDTLAAHRHVTLNETGTDQASLAKAQNEARELLLKTNSDALIWGKVITIGSNKAMRLFWSTREALSDTKATGLYAPEANAVALPPLFWDDLKQILGLLVQALIASLTNELTGHYSADRLFPLIRQNRELLANKKGIWDPETEAGVRSAFADALQIYGEQPAQNDALTESIDSYEQVLILQPRDKSPLDWAMTQNNLGVALLRLGTRENGTHRLKKSVEAFRATLDVYTQDRSPLDWAMTQSNLGLALETLGNREGETQMLEEAVQAYRAALQEHIRERVPLYWAMTQNNLGLALLSLGERKNGTQSLKEAVEAFQAALQEHTRERVPLYRAMTQNNLGNALEILGRRESETQMLKEAVEAFQAALQEYTRHRVPLKWAMTQNNLGNVLLTLGQLESGTQLLKRAVQAYRAALEGWTRHEVPLDWATAQNNLGNALAMLGERENDIQGLEAAVQAYRAALEVWRRDGVPLHWAIAQSNLGNTQAQIGKRKNDIQGLEAAVAAYNEAISVAISAKAEYQASEWTDNRKKVLALIASRKAARPGPAAASVTH